jgi:hypothetical protein
MVVTKEDVVVLVDAVAMGAAFFYILFQSFQVMPSRRFLHRVADPSPSQGARLEASG